MTLQNSITLKDNQIAADIKLLASRIGDLTSLTTTQKTNLVDALNEIHAAIGSSALDTLNELAAALNDDPNFATTLAASMNNKVDFANAQTLTTAQRLQACENIGIGDPDTDFLGSYLTARGPL